MSTKQNLCRHVVFSKNGCFVANFVNKAPVNDSTTRVKPCKRDGAPLGSNISYFQALLVTWDSLCAHIWVGNSFSSGATLKILHAPLTAHWIAAPAKLVLCAARIDGEAKYGIMTNYELMVYWAETTKFLKRGFHIVLAKHHESNSDRRQTCSEHLSPLKYRTHSHYYMTWCFNLYDDVCTTLYQYKIHIIISSKIILYNYCISCYFREGFIFANFASQNLAKISTLNNLCIYL